MSDARLWSCELNKVENDHFFYRLFSFFFAFSSFWAVELQYFQLKNCKHILLSVDGYFCCPAQRLRAPRSGWGLWLVEKVFVFPLFRRFEQLNSNIFNSKIASTYFSVLTVIFVAPRSGLGRRAAAEGFGWSKKSLFFRFFVGLSSWTRIFSTQNLQAHTSECSTRSCQVR